MSPQEESGRGGRSVFEELLDQEFAEGRKQAAEERAQTELLKEARRVLEGRDE